MSRALDDLSSEFRPKAFELLARLIERGVAVMIIDTLRTPAEHAANLTSGASSSTLSKHLPRRLRGIFAQPEKSDAIDLCPYAVYLSSGPDKLNWDTSDPAFRIIMEEAEKLDLRSGRRWRTPHDPGHVELIISAHDRALVIEERRRNG